MSLAGIMNNSDKNIEKIIHLMQTDNAVDAPEDAIKWSKNIFRTRAASAKPGILERIVAVLNQELAPGKAAFGERSGSTAQSRQMLFEAGENRVDLRIAPKDGSYEVRGQILGDGCEDSIVILGKEEMVLDEFGGFFFDEVSAGTYELVIKTKDREIVLKAIEVE
jgi:hypothetical protein